MNCASQEEKTRSLLAQITVGVGSVVVMLTWLDSRRAVTHHIVASTPKIALVSAHLSATTIANRTMKCFKERYPFPVHLTFRWMTHKDTSTYRIRWVM